MISLYSNSANIAQVNWQQCRARKIKQMNQTRSMNRFYSRFVHPELLEFHIKLYNELIENCNLLLSHYHAKLLRESEFLSVKEGIHVLLTLFVADE